MNFYSIVEQNVVDKLKSLPRKVSEVKRFEAEFGGTFSVPEDYNPMKSYALVQAMGSAYRREGSSIKQNTLDGRVVVYVGNQTTGTLKAKDEVYELVQEIEDALQGYDVMYEGNKLCTLVIDSNSEQFLVPNHVCWNVTFQILAKKNFT